MPPEETPNVWIDLDEPEDERKRHAAGRRWMALVFKHIRLIESRQRRF
jgi:hypothetical protein